MTVNEGMKPYLAATFFIDSDTEPIKEKSQELTDSVYEAKERAVRLFYFVRDDIKYNVYADRTTDVLFKASSVLANKEGYCVQKAVLLVALARPVSLLA